MATAVEKKVRILSSGQEIMAYRHRERNTWIASSDCETEYQLEEIEFLN